MKHSEALRLAAQMVEGEHTPFGCWALHELDICCNDVAAFQLMRPTNREVYDRGGREPVHDGASWWPMGDDSRIIGLCLAAAIAESEGQ